MSRSDDPERVRDEANVAVIVAHPDDEVLWAGGQILSYREWHWFIATLCRAGDPDRAPRFRRVLSRLGAEGAMGDLDDGPDQLPLANTTVEETILSLLPESRFDLVMTHGPRGEYTRHRRHEETCRGVVSLWETGRIDTRRLWMFAYDDGGGTHVPRAEEVADLRDVLPGMRWREKYRIMTELYGFATDSWEARTTPREEAFLRFESPEAARDWIKMTGPTE